MKRARARVVKPKDGPFDGYRRREVPPPDPELTRVGPGAPCGEYLRRFWQPVAFARDLASAPLRARILGEELVVFRDRGGCVGVLHLHCAHRGTSVEFGIPLERGIRCCYHGWVYDVDGRCLETPREPVGSRLKERGGARRKSRWNALARGQDDRDVHAGPRASRAAAGEPRGRSSASASHRPLGDRELARRETEERQLGGA